MKPENRISVWACHAAPLGVTMRQYDEYCSDMGDYLIEPELNAEFTLVLFRIEMPYRPRPEVRHERPVAPHRPQTR